MNKKYIKRVDDIINHLFDNRTNLESKNNYQNIKSTLQIQTELRDKKINYNISDISTTLNKLVKEGFVEIIKKEDGVNYYCISFEGMILKEEKGYKKYLRGKSIEKLKWWVPILISGLALVVAYNKSNPSNTTMILLNNTRYKETKQDKQDTQNLPKKCIPYHPNNFPTQETSPHKKKKK